MNRDTQQLLLRHAYNYAWKESDDPDTKNGAVLINSTTTAILGFGANRFPRGVKVTPERLVRPAKYLRMEHAERDVILRCTRHGVPTDEAIMVCPWAPCADCARAIVIAGISTLVVHKSMMDRTPERWKESIAEANSMLDEGGVSIVTYDGEIGGCDGFFDGQEWKP